MKDSVDNMIKQYMNTTLDELRDLPKIDKNRVLFVLIYGDRDFSSEINAVRRLNIDMVVIHSADNPVRPSIKQLLQRPELAPCCWLDIVAAGGNTAGNPYYHVLAQDPLLPAQNPAQNLFLPVNAADDPAPTPHRQTSPVVRRGLCPMPPPVLRSRLLRPTLVQIG